MRNFKKILAEFIGTFALVFVGVGSIMVQDLYANALVASMIPVVFGLVVAAMIYAVGHISGAHFNPAVTWAFALVRHLPKKLLLGYWAGQFLGAIFAMGILIYLFPVSHGMGQTLPAVGAIHAVVLEMILSFFLMFVIIATATDTRAQGVMAGAAIGATVCFCAFVAGPLTGASMNPARSFAPALFAQEFSSLWIYFVGPFLGTSLGALAYQFIRG